MLSCKREASKNNITCLRDTFTLKITRRFHATMLLDSERHFTSNHRKTCTKASSDFFKIVFSFVSFIFTKQFLSVPPSLPHLSLSLPFCHGASSGGRRCHGNQIKALANMAVERSEEITGQEKKGERGEGYTTGTEFSGYTYLAGVANKTTRQ